MQGVHGLVGLGADLVGQAQGAGHLPVDEDVEDDRPLLTPGTGDRELGDVAFLQEAGTPDLHH